MELHLVHSNTDEPKEKIAVVGVLYKIGKPDSFLSKVIKHILILQYTSYTLSVS